MEKLQEAFLCQGLYLAETRSPYLLVRHDSYLRPDMFCSESIWQNDPQPIIENAAHLSGCAAFYNLLGKEKVNYVGLLGSYFRYREASLFPGTKATLQAGDVGVTVGQQDGHGHRGTMSTTAVDHDLGVLVSRPHGLVGNEALNGEGQ